jgi:hypothetical protein
MTYYIETYQNSTQLLGSDFTTVVRNVHTGENGRKMLNAKIMHADKLRRLKNIHPSLSKGYHIEITKTNHLK